MKRGLILLSIFIGLPVLGAVITIIMGLAANAPGCFLLTMGFCLIGAFSTYISLRLAEKSRYTQND